MQISLPSISRGRDFDGSPQAYEMAQYGVWRLLLSDVAQIEQLSGSFAARAAARCVILINRISSFAGSSAE